MPSSKDATKKKSATPKSGGAAKKKVQRKKLADQNFSMRSMYDLMAAGGAIAGRRSTANLQALDALSTDITNYYVQRAALISKLLGRKKMTARHLAMVQFAHAKKPVFIVACPKRKKKKASAEGKKAKKASGGAAKAK